MRRFLLAAGSLALLSASFGTAEAAKRKVSVPNRYDGNWSIEVITQDGPCDRAYRYGVRIAKGEASYPGGDFDIRGRVTGNGAVRATIMRGSDGANVVGQLDRGGYGSGTWSSNGMIRCSGRWNAEKRG
ncbi:hypothetical protein FPV16_01500 [Methylobacterium sp. W2]|uniref:hypothetical protein n=1 Tax=Methylobacterium sp. W2 TaxID=2598107 RepID=UPI001D0C91E1|nr:hypothetical protein [Methylobacterium sp. W2]MCC0804907.1 hypothetical protein [Methylobacterium sp. W2]